MHIPENAGILEFFTLFSRFYAFTCLNRFLNIKSITGIDSTHQNNPKPMSFEHNPKTFIFLHFSRAFHENSGLNDIEYCQKYVFLNQLVITVRLIGRTTHLDVL